MIKKTTMRRFLLATSGLLIIGMLWVAVAAHASTPAQPPDEVAGVLEESFAEFKKQVAKDPRKYGFSSAADVEQATVEAGYPVYVLDEKSLPDFKGNIYQLEEYGYEWDFVIHDSQNEAKTFMEIAYDEMDKRFFLSAFGGDPAPLTAGTEAMRAFAGEEAKNVHFVKTGDERLLIFEYKFDGKLAPYAIPLNEATTPEMKPLDYRETIEYVKKVNGLAHDAELLKGKEEAPQSNGQIFIWTALFAVLMIIVIRIANKNLRKEREKLAEADKKRLQQRRNLKP
jgi:hypothetical protein